MPTQSLQARNIKYSSDPQPPTGLLVPARTEGYPSCMAWQGIITLEPGKRGGRPCVRGMRITVADVLGWLAVGMTHAEIISDYAELTEEDIRACLSYAADRERGVLIAA
jgi:uncharacterized protein (DUF433 family)